MTSLKSSFVFQSDISFASLAEDAQKRVCSARNYNPVFTVQPSGPVDYVSIFQGGSALLWRHSEQEHPLALHALASQLQSVNYAFDAVISKCLIKFRNGFQSNTWDHNAFILQNGGHLAFKIENRQENVAMCKY